MTIPIIQAIFDMSALALFCQDKVNMVVRTVRIHQRPDLSSFFSTFLDEP